MSSTLPTELYDSVPKDHLGNLRYREQIRRWACGNRHAQQALISACRKDIFYWLATFCWLFEPRNKQVMAVLPFIPWPQQVPALTTMYEVLNSDEQGDVGIEKARGEGASWLVLMLFLHDWLFSHGMRSFGIVSRNLDMADNPDDPSSLFSKIDWQLGKLPAWMVGHRDVDWKRQIAKHTLRNVRTGSTITAYPCTEDMAAGGRHTAFLMDELARFERGKDAAAMGASEPVTNCRFLVSTYNGPHGSYYELMADSNSSMTKIVLNWEENPTRNQGLYKVDDNKLPVAVDPVNNPLPKDYLEKWPAICKKLEERGYDLTRLRSPWYDARCLRPDMTPRKVSQEYDRDPGGSGSRFFVSHVIDRLLRETAKPPVHTGELEFDAETWQVKFVPQPGGRLKLWLDLDMNRRPVPDDFAVGADVATGTHGPMSSNSALSGARVSTGEKILEFASPSTLPHDFADLAIAVCYFLVAPTGQTAMMIWEDMGPGKQFKTRVLATSFRNFYMRYSTEKITRKREQVPGWSGQKAAKAQLLGHYGTSLTEGTFVNQSELALKECKQYIYGPGDKIMHIAESDTDDPSGAGGNHGDRVIADALVAWLLKDLGKRSTRMNDPKQSRRIPPNSFRGRQIRAQQAEKRKSFWSA